MQRSTPSAVGRTSHAAHPSHGWHHASLYNLISRSALYRPLDASDLLGQLKDVFGDRNPLYSYMGLVAANGRSDGLNRLIELMRIPYPHDMFWTTGAGLLAPSARSPSCTEQHQILCPTLRYCPSCMQLGYHTMLYQHWALTECPVHHRSLRVTCMSCREQIRPTLSATFEQPFACPKCGHLMIKTAAQPTDVDSVREIEWHVARLWNDLAFPAGTSETRIIATRDLVPLSGERLPSAQQVRAIRRATAWSPWMRAGSPWGRHDEVLESVPKELGDPLTASAALAKCRETERVSTQMLDWLRAECGVPDPQSTELIGSSWQRIQYISPRHEEGRFSAVAVALHLTMTKYGVFPVNYRALAAHPQTAKPYVGVRWNGLRATSTPLQYGPASGAAVGFEILGFFVLSLLRCAGLMTLNGEADVDPHQTFEERAYCPTWRFEGATTGWLLRIRPRASKELVQRLLQRYRDRPLQRLVQCSAPVGPVQAPTEALSSVDFPPELIHFPHGVATKATEKGLAQSDRLRIKKRRILR